MHASLAAHILPYNLDARDPVLAHALAGTAGRYALDGRLSAQAGMVAYLDDYQFMFYLTPLLLPLLVLMRNTGGARDDVPRAPID